MMLNRITRVEREGGLPGGERDRGRGEAGEQDRRRQQEPQHASCSVPTSREQAPRRRRSRRPCRAARAATFWPVLERVRAQHRQRAEHDPERVLHAGQVGDEHGEAEADRRRAGCCAATPSAGRRAPPRAPAPRPSGPGNARRADGRAAAASQLRRSAAAASSMLVAICETAKLSSWARKLGSSEVTSSRSRRGSRAGAGAAGTLDRRARAPASTSALAQRARAPRRAAVRSPRRSASSRSAPRSSTAAAARLDGAAPARLDAAAPAGGAACDDDRVQPAELVDQPHHRAGRRAQAGRAVRASRRTAGRSGRDRRVRRGARRRRAPIARRAAGVAPSM